MAVVTALRREGLLLAWQQSDEAGLPERGSSGPLLPARPRLSRDATRASGEHPRPGGGALARSTWHGFRRPEPLGAPDG
ncbi:MAG: hypothetical protein R3C32_06515 [Chloroflexota bacterium]